MNDEEDKQYLSFPDDSFYYSNDNKSLSGFYSKMKSITTAATSAVSNVLPGKQQDELSSSPFTGAQMHYQQMQESPLRYIQEDTNMVSSHKASPSIGGVTWSDEDVNHSDVSTIKPLAIPQQQQQQLQQPTLSRTPSVNTNYSYSIRDHLPGYAMERDPSSDSESIVSTRDYIIANIDSRMKRSGGLGKEFWMKDENATDCFKCSKSFKSMFFYIYIEFEKEKLTF